MGIKEVVIKIKELPIDDRPREKLELKGASALSDAELVAILLRTGTKDKTAIQLAQEILAQSGGLRELCKYKLSDLLKISKGIKKVKSITLLAALEISNRIAQTDIIRNNVQIKSPIDVFNIFKEELSQATVEHFYILILNSSNTVKKKCLISTGSLNASVVTPREVFKIAIDNQAASIILIHNHPSGNLEPSIEDKNLTAKLVNTGQILSIPVYDHLIIGNNNFYSFLDNNLIL